MPTILSGKQLANDMKADLSKRSDELKKKGINPKTAVIVLDLDLESPSNTYVSFKKQYCAEVGISCDVHRLSPKTSQTKLLNLMAKLNSDPLVCGILVQLPLPTHINQDTVIAAINPDKDLDGMHPRNLGLLKFGTPFVLPCAAAAAMKLVHSTNQNILGKRAVVIGCSRYVGDPIAHLLSKQGVTATTIDKDGKQYIEDTVKQADIVITATGKYQEGGHVKSEWLREGCIVIDVATHRVDGRIRGDVDRAALNNPKVAFIATVPGGVGPVTVAIVAENALRLAEALRTKLKDSLLTGYRTSSVQQEPNTFKRAKVDLSETTTTQARSRSYSVPDDFNFVAPKYTL